MQKISYINQMNSFITKCSEDALPANAVVMYLMLFNCFNRSCWRNTWMRFTIQQLMAFTHVGSPNTVYNMRRLLKELGYIDYQTVKNGMRSHVEYHLVPLGISSRNGSGITEGMTGITSIAGIAGMADITDTTDTINTMAGITAGCAFADIPCDNKECSANESYANAGCTNTSYTDTSYTGTRYANASSTNTLSANVISANKSSADVYANSQRSLFECSNNERSNSEYSLSERSKSECSVSECSISERSKNECSISECSVSESSINAPAKSECSKSENSNSECSISESSRRQYAGECSGECSKSERRPDNSPNREEKDKKRNTSHDTSQKYEEEINNNLNNNNSSHSNNDNDNKQPMSVSEFLRTNGDYLLCVDAYRDYFHQEPPASDKVLIIRFLADYGVNSTLSAMDVMMQNKADSLSCCETVLRQSQWKINRKAIRRPVLSKEWAGWRMA